MLTGLAAYCFVIMALDGCLIYEKFVMDKLTVTTESKPARFTVVKVCIELVNYIHQINNYYSILYSEQLHPKITQAPPPPCSAPSYLLLHLLHLLQYYYTYYASYYSTTTVLLQYYYTSYYASYYSTTTVLIQYYYSTTTPPTTFHTIHPCCVLYHLAITFCRTSYQLKCAFRF